MPFPGVMYCAKEARKCLASTQGVLPGIIPHQQGRRQPAFLLSKSNIYALESSGSIVGSIVQVGDGVDVEISVGVVSNIDVDDLVANKEVGVDGVEPAVDV